MTQNLTPIISKVVVICLGVIAAFAVVVNTTGMSFGTLMSAAAESGKNITYDMSFGWDTYNTWMNFICGFVCWVSYFGFNQEQIQRYVTAKNVRDIKKTGILSSAVMMGIYWLTFVLGIILFVYYQNVSPTLDFTNSNNVLVDFILTQMPTGLVGLLLAAVFVAAMSSLDSILNSATAIFTKDIYEPYFAKGKKASAKQSMLFTCIIGVLVIIFVYLYLGDSTSSIMLTIGSLCAPLQGTLSGIMFSILYVGKINDKGCAYGSALSILASYAIRSQEANLGLHWMWCYLYAAVLSVVFSYILSMVFKNEEETAKAARYTMKGAIAATNGVTDPTGYEIRPMKFDRYAVWTLAVFVFFVVLAIYLQMF